MQQTTCMTTQHRQLQGSGIAAHRSRCPLLERVLLSKHQPQPFRYTSNVRCMAKPWRPSMDDVDRLSRGEAAKIRGTGCRDIPHRLNAEERPVYEAAKKKGYLAVRGNGMRRGRKGAPLPNIYRQWCDAKEWPCIVIEQDSIGLGEDTVVADLSTLRSMNTHKVEERIKKAAQELGARLLTSEQRSPELVPFDTLVPDAGQRLSLPQGRQQVMAGALSSSAQLDALSDTSSTAPPTSHSSSSGSNNNNNGLGSNGNDNQRQHVQHAAASSAPTAALSGDSARSDELAALQSAVDEVAAYVRQLKEVQGLSNSDALVVESVQHMKDCKARLEAAQSVSSALQQPASLSPRAAAFLEAFTEPSDVEQQPPAALNTDVAVSQQDGRGSAQSSSHPPVPQSVQPTDADNDGDAAISATASDKAVFDRAIWQIQPHVMFYAADRLTAKRLAAAIAPK